MRVTVTLSRDAAEALLRTLPSCCECGQLAEVRLEGLPLCAGCATGHRSGRFTALEHAPAALAISDALSPHVPAGKWAGGLDG